MKLNTLEIQKYQLKKPVEFEEYEGQEIIAYPEKTLIRTDNESLAKDLHELLATAKLAETDPLLATFFFQSDNTEQEERFFSMFFRLCQPLQDAWIMKTIREYAPEAYEKEIAEIYRMNMLIQDFKIADTGPVFHQADDNAEKRRMSLGFWLMCYENPDNDIKIEIKTDDDNRDDWENYIEALKQFSRMSPDVNLFLKLPEIVNAPYAAKIKEDDRGFRYYDVRIK